MVFFTYCGTGKVLADGDAGGNTSVLHQLPRTYSNPLDPKIYKWRLIAQVSPISPPNLLFRVLKQHNNTVQSPRPPASTKPWLGNWMQTHFAVISMIKVCGFLLFCMLFLSLQHQGSRLLRMFSTAWKIQHLSNCVSCRNETGSFNKWFGITSKSHIEWNSNQNLVGLFWRWKLISNFAVSVKRSMWCFEMQVIDDVKLMHHNVVFVFKRNDTPSTKPQTTLRKH